MIPAGLLFVGLLIRTVFAAAIVIVIAWLLLKLGRLADAYTDKIKTQASHAAK